MKAIMVGGGTGGHIYPAIAVAEAIQDHIMDSQVLFIGSEDGPEIRIVPKERFTISTIKARGMLRKLTIRSITSPFFAVISIIESYKLIKSFKPDVIVATGGFVSLPVLIAGFLQRVPSVMLEPNFVPGITTRICKWFASRIVIAFEGSRKYFRFRKVYCMGVPVRKQILSSLKGVAIQNLGLRQDQPMVLILGGSQGAKSINRCVLEALPELEKLDIQVLHVSGQRDFDWISDGTKRIGGFYHLIPYMDNIWDGLAGADLVISRSGAASISEILVRGLPSILIPFPFSSERHQDLNAKVLSDAGAASVIKDSDLSGPRIAGEVKRILQDRPLYLQMCAASKALGKPNASREIVAMITNLLGIDLTAVKKKRTYVRKRKTDQ